MMKRTPASPLLYVLLSAVLGMASCTTHTDIADRPLNLDGTCWTDGYEYFVGSPDTITHNDSLTLFLGGNLHEGGYGFALRRLAADTFLICTIPGTPMVAVGVVGDTVVVRPDSPDDTLLTMICYRPDDPEADTLRQYAPQGLSPMEAYSRLLLQSRLDALSGTYTDAAKGITFQFADTTVVRTLRGKTDTATFHIFYSFDMPSHTIILSNGDRYSYQLTPQGLDLYAVSYYQAEDDYAPTRLLYTLTRQQ